MSFDFDTRAARVVTARSRPVLDSALVEALRRAGYEDVTVERTVEEER